MISVTADANIYISALIFSGVPRQFLLAADAGRFRLAVSQPILDELAGVLAEKFGWSATALQQVRDELQGCATLVQPTITLDVVPDDRTDNRVIECAVAAGSKFIVTGDSDLLRLGKYAEIKILKVADFMAIVGEPAS